MRLRPPRILTVGRASWTRRTHRSSPHSPEQPGRGRPRPAGHRRSRSPRPAYQSDLGNSRALADPGPPWPDGRPMLLRLSGPPPIRRAGRRGGSPRGGGWHRFGCSSWRIIPAGLGKNPRLRPAEEESPRRGVLRALPQLCEELRGSRGTGVSPGSCAPLDSGDARFARSRVSPGGSLGPMWKGKGRGRLGAERMCSEAEWHDGAAVAFMRKRLPKALEGFEEKEGTRQ